MEWPALEEALQAHLGSGCQIRGRRPVPGGCINEAWRVDTSAGAVFLKLNHPDLADLFAAEWNGLQALRRPGVLRVPEPLARGVDGDASWLLTEYIELGPLTDAAAARLGERLAALHREAARTTGRSDFGHQRANYIGRTPQDNRPHREWADFFVEQRLRPQRELAREDGAPRRLIDAVDAVIAAVPEILRGHQPSASLLHGDLWRGNCAADAAGEPVLFDPAVYAGDREADLAMTELFGRLPDAFYAAYHSTAPLPANYRRRRQLYNLYHILNHHHLFGGAYAEQAQQMCLQLLRG